jgi:hypothetical protein
MMATYIEIVSLLEAKLTNISKFYQRIISPLEHKITELENQAIC